MAKIVKDARHRYEQIKSFSAKFTEAITPVGAPTRTRTGTVFLSKPGKMRWEFGSPTKEIVVSDGTTIYSYDPDLNQVVETPLQQALNTPGATDFLLGMGNLSAKFEASALTPPPNDGLVHVVLRRKDSDEKIELALTPKTYDVSALKITDALGNVTAISLTELNVHPMLVNSLFEFTLPAGADIVRANSLP